MPPPPNRPTKLLKPAKAGRRASTDTPRKPEKSVVDSVLDTATGRRQVAFYNSKSKYPKPPTQRRAQTAKKK